MFRIDREALRSRKGMMIAGLALAFGVLVMIFGEWSLTPRYIPKGKVWSAVEREAAKHDLDPQFVFAVVAAESSFNSRAKNGDARGLMQIRPIAWREVSGSPRWRAWGWRKNIAVGTAYLGNLKKFLEDHEQFSYPKLAACYRHGPYALKRAGFNLEELPVTRNEIYRQLFRGDISPVPRP